MKHEIRVTIAIELPVWLYPSELRKLNLLPEAKKSLTGHVDILQIMGKIHILDYKPEIEGIIQSKFFSMH